MAKRGLIFGVGINDADYSIAKCLKVDDKWKVVWWCPYYVKWKDMLYRCYSKKEQERHPTYKGCTVCEEWLTFSNFKKWMETQNWEGRALDKDFLIEGNKVYNHSTCAFLPNKLNTFIVTRGNDRGQYPLGVTYQKKAKYMKSERSKPYKSQISYEIGKMLYLGHYSTPEDPHQRYLQEKLSQCEIYCKAYKDEKLIIKGLTRIRDKIKYHLNNKLELTSF